MGCSGVGGTAVVVVVAADVPDGAPPSSGLRVGVESSPGADDALGDDAFSSGEDEGRGVKPDGVVLAAGVLSALCIIS